MALETDNEALRRNRMPHAGERLSYWRALVNIVQIWLMRIPDRVRHPLMNVCSIICLMTPLFMWASMKIWMAKAFVVLGAVAFVVLYILVWSYPRDRI